MSEWKSDAHRYPEKGEEQMVRLPDELIIADCPQCSGTGQISDVNPRWLRAVREKMGRSLRETARHLKISASHLSDIERGNRNCPDYVQSHYGKMNPREPR